MKPTFLLILLIALAVAPLAQGGWVRWRRVWNTVKTAATAYSTIKTVAGIAAAVGRKRGRLEQTSGRVL